MIALDENSPTFNLNLVFTQRSVARPAANLFQIHIATQIDFLDGGCLSWFGLYSKEIDDGASGDQKYKANDQSKYLSLEADDKNEAKNGEECSDEIS